jgi:UDP-glucuronate decarboxylase
VLRLGKTISSEIQCGQGQKKYVRLATKKHKKFKKIVTRAQTALGWNPTIPLREGLKRTVEDFKGRVNG